MNIGSTREVAIRGEVVTLYSHPCCRVDEWVLQELKGKRDGFFVEIGAYNGIRYSDTFALERGYGWTGILVEPDPDVFRDLRVLRPNAILCNHAIAPYSIDEDRFYRGGPYGSLVAFTDQKQIEEHARRKNDVITVPTIRLDQLLAQAPDVIDFLCLDVEGAELPILESFFVAAQTKVFRTMAIEFNFDYAKLRSLKQLLEPFGYECCELRGWDSCWRNFR